jgi:hypothetical protein
MSVLCSIVFGNASSRKIAESSTPGALLMLALRVLDKRIRTAGMTRDQDVDSSISQRISMRDYRSVRWWCGVGDDKTDGGCSARKGIAGIRSSNAIHYDGV